MAPCIDDKDNIAWFRRRRGYGGQVAVFVNGKKPLALGPTMELSERA